MKLFVKLRITLLNRKFPTLNFRHYVKPNSPLENLNQSSISEIKEQFSVGRYSDDEEKDTQNL